MVFLKRLRLLFPAFIYRRLKGMVRENIIFFKEM